MAEDSFAADNVSVSEKQYQKLLIRIATNIRKQRLKMKLTQEEMTLHGFDYRYYQRIESGKYSMSLYTLLKLASVFKIDISEILKK